MQTGVVDGQIGGTPTMALESFADITKTWVQFNDHFELDYFFINSDRYAALSEEDQKALQDAALEVAATRFAEVEAADEAALQTMRDAGVEVVTFDDAMLAKLADTARTEVWPQIVDELGPEHSTSSQPPWASRHQPNVRVGIDRRPGETPYPGVALWKKTTGTR